MGDCMIYILKIAEKKKLFQKSFWIEDDSIFATDTARGKRRFLKSGIKNVVFDEKIAGDKVFSEYAVAAIEYDEQFAAEYIEDMIKTVAEFFKFNLPIDEIAIDSFSNLKTEILAKYARLITLVGKESDCVIDGVTIRAVEKLKSPPSLIIRGEGSKIPELFKVPTIDLSFNGRKNAMTLSADTVCFKTNVFPFEIGMWTLVYFLKKGEKINYELSTCRKKAPLIYTFY